MAEPRNTKSERRDCALRLDAMGADDVLLIAVRQDPSVFHRNLDVKGSGYQPCALAGRACCPENLEAPRVLALEPDRTNSMGMARCLVVHGCLSDFSRLFER
jgi:hypothetical protein